MSSEPPGADIYVDGASTGQQTPADVKLPANKAKVRRDAPQGGLPREHQQVDIATLTEDDAKSDRAA